MCLQTLGNLEILQLDSLGIRKLKCGNTGRHTVTLVAYRASTLEKFLFHPKITKKTVLEEMIRMRKSQGNQTIQKIWYKVKNYDLLH